MKYNEMTLDEALGYVKSVRPVVNPNASFLEQLRAFDQTLALARPPPESNPYGSYSGGGGGNSYDVCLPPSFSTTDIHVPSNQYKLSETEAANQMSHHLEETTNDSASVKRCAELILESDSAHADNDGAEENKTIQSTQDKRIRVSTEDETVI
ncbi:unnamed protein product [Sphagnum compactum]